MSNQITTAFVKQFTDGITLLAQQRGSRLRDAVNVDSGITGDRAFYDQISATAAVQKTTRHGDTPLVETPHSRRMLTLADWEWADLIDDSDKLKTLNDPTNAYTKNAAYAMGRTIDAVIRDAFFATASTSVDGTGTAAFPAGNIVGVSGAGLTIAKLREAREILESADNMEDDGEYQWYIAITARQKRDLLATTEVTSSDFASVKALVGGTVDTFLGFKFIDYQGLVEDATPDRLIPAWCKSSMKLGIGMEPKGDIGIRRDKSNSTQVFYSMSIGATRMDETGVVQIICDEP